MFESAGDFNVLPFRADQYLPVSGGMALGVLIGVTVVSLLLGMLVFHKKSIWTRGRNTKN